MNSCVIETSDFEDSLDICEAELFRSQREVSDRSLWKMHVLYHVSRLEYLSYIRAKLITSDASIRACSRLNKFRWTNQIQYLVDFESVCYLVRSLI